MDIRNFDKRILQRNLEKGLVTEKDYKKYLSGLKDLEQECDEIDLLPCLY